MKKTIIALVTAFSLLTPAVALSGNVAAVDIFQNSCGKDAANTQVCKDVDTQQHSNENPIIHIIHVAINILSIVIGIAAVIGIIVSSIKFMTAAGDSNAVASARTGLIYSLIGIAVAALAQFIITVVVNNT